MPAPVETAGFPSGVARKRHESLKAKARLRACERLAAMFPVQFEQLVLVEMTQIRKEQGAGS